MKYKFLILLAVFSPKMNASEEKIILKAREIVSIVENYNHNEAIISRIVSRKVSGDVSPRSLASEHAAQQIMTLLEDTSSEENQRIKEIISQHHPNVLETIITCNKNNFILRMNIPKFHAEITYTKKKLNWDEIMEKLGIK